MRRFEPRILMLYERRSLRIIIAASRGVLVVVAVVIKIPSIFSHTCALMWPGKVSHVVRHSPNPTQSRNNALYSASRVRCIFSAFPKFVYSVQPMLRIKT